MNIHIFFVLTLLLFFLLILGLNYVLIKVFVFYLDRIEDKILLFCFIVILFVINFTFGAFIRWYTFQYFGLI